MYVSSRTSSSAASMADSMAAKYSAPLFSSVMRFPRTGIKRESGRQPGRERDVVREPGPRTAHMALDAVELEIADVDAVEREQRQPRRVAARMPPLGALENLVEAQRLGELHARLALPVVEVAGDHEGPVRRHRGADALAEPL